MIKIGIEEKVKDLAERAERLKKEFDSTIKSLEEIDSKIKDLKKLRRENEKKLVKVKAELEKTKEEFEELV